MPANHLLVVSDCHGNTRQYDQIFAYASRETTCKGLLHCGDIGPRHNVTTKDLRTYLKKYFIPKIDSLQRARGGKFPVFVMMGNSDHRVNEPFLWDKQRLRGRRRYTCVHGRIVPFHDLYIAGYSYIPPTPCAHKEGERADGPVSSPPVDRGDFTLSGFSATYRGRKSIDLDRMPTIAQEVSTLFSRHKAFDRTLFACHAPPFGTNLDCNKPNEHVGSVALSSFITTHPFKASFHGHVHQTVDVSGCFSDIVGQTPAYTLGNDPNSDNPTVILYELTSQDVLGRAPTVIRCKLVHAKPMQPTFPSPARSYTWASGGLGIRGGRAEDPALWPWRSAP